MRFLKYLLILQATLFTLRVYSFEEMEYEDSSPSSIEQTENTNEVIPVRQSFSDPFKAQEDNVEKMKNLSLLLDQNPYLRTLSQTAKRRTIGQPSNFQCWGGTKKSLIAARIISRDLWYPLGGIAREAVALEKYGFVNIISPGRAYMGLKNLCMLPRGTILLFMKNGPTMRLNPIYRKYEPVCGSQSCGHATVKIGGVGNGAEGSDFYSDTLITGSCEREGRGYFLTAAYLPEEIYEEGLKKLNPM